MGVEPMRAHLAPKLTYHNSARHIGTPGEIRTQEIPWWDSNPHTTTGGNANTSLSGTRTHRTLSGTQIHVGAFPPF